MKKTTIAASKKTTTQVAKPKKATTKKTTTVKKETVAKKTTSKTTYKPVKMNLQVQYNYHDVSLDDIEKMVIDHLVKLGYKKTSILTLDIYYKQKQVKYSILRKQIINKYSKTMSLYTFSLLLPFLIEGDFFISPLLHLLKKENTVLNGV